MKLGLATFEPQCVWTDLDLRARSARMCPALYFVQKGIVALAGARTLLNEIDVRAKVAQEA
eukprot:9473578-Pyramimonas_sp.AAC.1